MVSTRSNSQAPDTPPPPPTSVPLNDLTLPASNGNANGIPIVQMTADLSKSGDSIINTPAGDVRVRPYRSSSNAQLKALLTFTPRVGALDRENVRSQTDEFRGFFTLFWIGLALLFMRTSLQSWDEHRTPLSWNFGRLITRDAFVLAISDGLMTATMFLCVPFVKALQYRWFSYYYIGLVIQHTFQTFYLAAAVWWGYHRQWYWVQSGFLVLHCLSNLMKMHSYMAHNGMLATVFFRLQSEKAQLAQLIDSLPESREQLLEEAAARQSELERQAAGSGSATPIGTPGLFSSSGTTSYVSDPAELLKRQLSESIGTSSATAHSPLADPQNLRRRSITNLLGASAGSGAKKRSRPPATDALPPPTSDLPVGTSLEPSHTTTPHEPHAPSPLAWSPNERIAVLARNIDMMDEELRSNGAKGLIWPQNVTYRHFLDYLFIPTLVYQLEYPRTNIMRPWVVIEKIAATFGTFSLIYLITEHYIMPYTPKKGESLLRTYLELALPMMINYLLIFYIIFECVCTGFAELSYFADREFYQDWWNSTSWDQFSRKWNKPVHSFLLRHVYASTMDGLQLSRTSATFITFLLSALCHELVMAVVTKKIRPYLFLMQMAQLPMIALGRLPAVRRNKTVGNIVFWIGLLSGFPLLAICYLVW